MMTNTTYPTSQSPKRRRWIAIVSVTVVAIFGVVLAVWYVFGGFQARSFADVMSTNPDINPKEATAQLCSEVACDEAWLTDVGSYLQFSSEGQAEYWATVLGDSGRRSNNVVLDMRSVDLSFEQKRYAIDVLYSSRDWN